MARYLSLSALMREMNSLEAELSRVAAKTNVRPPSTPRPPRDAPDVQLKEPAKQSDARSGNVLDLVQELANIIGTN